MVSGKAGCNEDHGQVGARVGWRGDQVQVHGPIKKAREVGNGGGRMHKKGTRPAGVGPTSEDGCGNARRGNGRPSQTTDVWRQAGGSGRRVARICMSIGAGDSKSERAFL
jgi:hypothetical protein